MGRLKALRPRLRAMRPKVKAMPKRVDRFYTSPDWRALRQAKLAEGPARCCVDGCRASGRMILDHREERRDGGADLPSLDQLDWYCVGHHNSKTAAAKARRAQEGR